MIKLSFVRGSALRKVFIKGRKLSFLTAELNFEPFTIDLNKLEEKESKKKIKEMKMDKKDLEILSRLKTEKDIAKDVTNDFKLSGWKVIKSGNN